MNKKVYVLEGTYHNIEDSSTRTLYVFDTKYRAELYQASIEKTLEDFKELYEKFCDKHEFDWCLRECYYVTRLARAFRKKEPNYFWLDVFKGLNYSDYTPTFQVREIGFIGDFK